MNVEFQIMQHADRSHDRLQTLAALVQAIIAAAAGLPTAVCMTTLNPDGHFALR